MSTNEELVAAAYEHLAHNVWDDEIFVLADQLVTALEQVTAERDELIRQRDEVDAEVSKAVQDELDRVAEHRGRLIEERNALAAIVEQVKSVLVHPNRLDEHKDESLRWSIRKAFDMLPAPSVALDRVKAEALREAADAFEGATINVEIFGDSAEARYWQGANKSRGNLVASLRERADRIEKGESNG